MLVFGPFGFIEFWAHDDRRLLWAGAWIEGDIERAFPETVGEVYEINPAVVERRWRRYRASVERGRAEVVILSAARHIDAVGLYRILPSHDHRRLLEEWQSGASSIAEWEWWRHHAGRKPPGRE